MLLLHSSAVIFPSLSLSSARNVNLAIRIVPALFFPALLFPALFSEDAAVVGWAAVVVETLTVVEAGDADSGADAESVEAAAVELSVGVTISSRGVRNPSELASSDRNCEMAESFHS